MAAGNHYMILGVARTATPAEIKSAYRRLVLKHHPDHSPSPESARLFALAAEAYGVLGDTERRKHYDFILDRDERLLREAAERKATDARVAATKASTPRVAPSPSRPSAKGNGGRGMGSREAKPTIPAPTVAEQITRLNLVFSRGQLAEAERLATEIRARDSRQAVPYAVLGDIARGRGKLDEAQKLYAYATQMDPRNSVYARRYEELLDTMSKRPSLRTGIQEDDPKLAALGIGGLLVFIMALYVGLTKETPILPGVAFLSTFTLGAMVMLFLSGVVLGAALSAANMVDRFASLTSTATGRPGPALALATVAVVNFWAAAGLYVGLGFSQQAFNLSTTRTIASVAGLVAVFSLAAIPSGMHPGQIFAWGGNLAYLGAIAGWTVADSLKRG